MGGEVIADAIFDLLLERVVQFGTIPKHYEEWHVVFPTWLLDAHNQAIQHLWKRLYDSVDLTAPHSDSHPVNRGVRSPSDNGAARGRNLDPVPVSPHPRIHFEVALLIAFALRIIPEEQGHRGHR